MFKNKNQTKLFLLFLMLGVLLFSKVKVYAYTGSCSFIGTNTALALQQTEALLANLKNLRDSRGCTISDRSISAMEKVNRYLGLYTQNKNFEHQLVAYNAQLEQYQQVYQSAQTDDEKTFWMEQLLGLRTAQIVTRAQMSISQADQRDQLMIYTLQDFAGEISQVIENAASMNECFISKPELAGMILSGIVNMTGSIASVATVNPIWGGVGGLIGNLITTLTNYISKYQWNKYIKQVDKKLLYHSLMCMIEMQANFYCEKDDEISILRQIITRIEQADNSDGGDGNNNGGNTSNNQSALWPGFDIQANSVPVIQTWIKTIHRGLPPTSGSDASEQNELLMKINSAEMIQNQILGRYEKVKEQYNDGTGEKYNILIEGGVAYISMFMGGASPTSRSGSGSGGYGNGSGSGSSGYDSSYTIGQQYFTARFLSELIPYVLITPPDGDNYENFPAEAPRCGDTEVGCNQKVLFDRYLRQKYGLGENDSINDSVLDRILGVVGKRIDYIFAKVNTDINNDLIRRRIRDPEVLLSKAKNVDFPYKVSAEKGLIRIKSYLEEVVGVWKKKLGDNTNEDLCAQVKKKFHANEKQTKSVRELIFGGLGLNRSKSFALALTAAAKIKIDRPVELQLLCETKDIVSEIIFQLNNNSAPPKDRIIRITQILRFSTDRTLFFIARISEILKTDLNLRTELGLLTPREEEMLILKEKDLLLKLSEEQDTQNVNFNQAIKERQSAQAIVRDNLKVLTKLSPLRSRVVEVTNEWAREAARELNESESESPTAGEYSSKYGEACAIILSLPFSYRQNLNWKTGGESLYNACKKAKAESEWNAVRRTLNRPTIPELDVNFLEVYNEVNYPIRICTYREYLRKNVVYGIKKRYRQ